MPHDDIDYNLRELNRFEEIREIRHQGRRMAIISVFILTYGVLASIIFLLIIGMSDSRQMVISTPTPAGQTQQLSAPQLQATIDYLQIRVDEQAATIDALRATISPAEALPASTPDTLANTSPPDS